jgi:hypothetical protein
MSEEKFKGMCPECGGKKEKDGTPCPACRGTGALEFQLAGQDSVDYLATYVDFVMKAIEKTTGVKGAWVSDESSIGDFPVEDKELALIEKELGLSVQYEDKIVDIARRLKDA